MRVFVLGEQKIEAQVTEHGVLPSLEIKKVDASDLAQHTKAGSFLMLGVRAATLTVLKQLNEKDAGIIVFDAHVGALPIKPSHDSFLYHAIDILPKNRIILVGMRSLSVEEAQFLKIHNIRYFSMHSLMMESIQHVCDTIMETANSWGATYVSISLDVLDPAFATVDKPAVGGLTTRELLYFAQRLRLLRNFLAADIVEYAQAWPIAEKLLSELAVRQKPF